MKQVTCLSCGYQFELMKYSIDALGVCTTCSKCKSSFDIPLAETDIELCKYIWSAFTDVPMDPATECIEIDWNGFTKGTHREEIWHWFEETFNTSIYDLLYHLY